MLKIVEGLEVLKCAKPRRTVGFTKKFTKALHLHQLRKPAIDHFQKLIALSGKASDNVAFLGASDITAESEMLISSNLFEVNNMQKHDVAAYLFWAAEVSPDSTIL